MGGATIGRPEPAFGSRTRRRRSSPCHNSAYRSDCPSEKGHAPSPASQRRTGCHSRHGVLVPVRLTPPTRALAGHAYTKLKHISLRES